MIPDTQDTRRKFIMEKREQLYEGKAKKVFATDDKEKLIVSYKDDATAFNGEKKGTIHGKGVINNRMSNHLMRRLKGRGSHPLCGRALRHRYRGEKSKYCAPGSHHPQHLRRFLCQAVWCGGGHRL